MCDAPQLRFLPLAADLEQLRKQAKDLMQQHAEKDAAACEILRWLHRFALCEDRQILASSLSLHEAQLALAMSYGFRTWTALRDWVLEGARVAGLPDFPGPETVGQWQLAVDCLADMAEAPAALIVRRADPAPVVFVSSGDGDLPFRAGERLPGDGEHTFCSAVMEGGAPLVLRDARTDPRFRDGPCVEMGLVSFLGLPILGPRQTVFGSLCLLDRVERAFEPRIEQLAHNIRGLLESHLCSMHDVFQLNARNAQLTELLMDLRTARSITPICSYCRKVRDTAGQWQELETYLCGQIATNLSHSICPDCEARAMADMDGDACAEGSDDD